MYVESAFLFTQHQIINFLGAQIPPFPNLRTNNQNISLRGSQGFKRKQVKPLPSLCIVKTICIKLHRTIPQSSKETNGWLTPWISMGLCAVRIIASKTVKYCIERYWAVTHTPLLIQCNIVQYCVERLHRNYTVVAGAILWDKALFMELAWACSSNNYLFFKKKEELPYNFPWKLALPSLYPGCLAQTQHVVCSQFLALYPIFQLGWLKHKAVPWLAWGQTMSQ